MYMLEKKLVVDARRIFTMYLSVRAVGKIFFRSIMYEINKVVALNSEDEC
tara:strand:- start:1403 stop:1552 length:150 start_codon:yes stop_codon:yes gene_type:complete